MLSGPDPETHHNGEHGDVGDGQYLLVRGVLLDEPLEDIHAEGAAAGHQHAVNGGHGRGDDGNDDNRPDGVGEKCEHQVGDRKSVV